MGEDAIEDRGERIEVSGGAASRPLRLAMVSYSLPVEGKKRGGIERVAHDLAEGLAQRGHRVVVWSFDGAPLGVSYEVRRLPFQRFASSWLGLRLTMGYFGNVVSALPDYSDVDAVIAMGDSLLLPFRGRPVVRVMHGSALGEALSAKSPWRFLMQIGVYAQELVTALTQRGTVGVSENTRARNPFVRRVIPNGVDISRFAPAAGGKSRDPTILFVGTLDGRKRGHLLLDWFSERVRPAHPTARLIMVSPPGPDREGVSYRTGISMDDLAQLYRQAWVYASPSSYEGFGLPYVEAMASGTAVVATANPGSLEVLARGEFGLLPSDEEFPGALNRLLSDEGERAALEARGLERSVRYSLNSMLDAYEQLLNEICELPTTSGVSSAA